VNTKKPWKVLIKQKSISDVAVEQNLQKTQNKINVNDAIKYLIEFKMRCDLN
jgi:hypothetical protein